MNIDSAKKKLIDGRQTLEKAGDDSDLLGIALTRIHGALEDACRLWLSDPNVAAGHQLDPHNKHQVSWHQLFELMPIYYQWSSEDVEYVRNLNRLRNQAAHGDGFQGTRKDIEDYANYVEGLFNEERQPIFQNMERNMPFQTSKQANLLVPFQTSKVRYSQQKQANLLVAYALWGLGFFWLCGIHRFYLRKRVTGFIWLISFGFFGLGQILDLFLIPRMVKRRNRDVRRISERHLLDKLDRLDRILHETFARDLLKQEKLKPKYEWDEWLKPKDEDEW